MELGCIWMRRAGTNCLVIMKPPISSTPPTSPFSFPSLQHRLVPLLSSSRCSFSNTPSSSSVPFFSIDDNSNTGIVGINGDSKVLLKGIKYTELEKWVQSHGFRPGQALMLWKRLYGNNIWAHCSEELEGLNKDFKKMLSEHAELKALSLKDILMASDGTRKVGPFHGNIIVDFENHRRLQMLFSLEDGLVIETVVIPCNRGRTTVCVSSQVGCAMNCQFCYTGRQDFTLLIEP
ncbi:hypothetical protein HHK36_029635 [Tetracentron sinense]|uniref:Uncharacterized protein n=1 Tax=Tetracentron sinense TaxID=13715 RepID=A0A835D1Y9_TETSI|nr:hypothetical protein HHK36_029635 [Tetracentron sinense]